MVLVSLSLLAFLEMIFHLDTTVRTVFFTLGVVAYGTCAFWMVVLPMFKASGILEGDDDYVMAKRIGDFFPAIRDRLTNFLQLHEEASKAQSLYSFELLEASFKDLADAVRQVDFSRAVDDSMIGLMRKWFLFSIAGAALFLAAFPASMPAAYFRLAHFNTQFTAPPRYTFAVMPGNKEVVKGEAVDVRVRLSSANEFVLRPSSLDLFSRVTGQDRFDQVSMKPDSSGLYHSLLQNVKVTTEYYVQAADVQSERYALTVLDRPIIRSLRVRLEFPAYSKLPARLQDEFNGDVTALSGTRVFVTGAASKELHKANIVFGRDSLAAITIEGTKFSGSFRLKQDVSYYIGLTDKDSLTNLDPVHYNLKMIPDEWPTVAIIQPGRNLDIAGDQSMRLLIHAEDDFGFSQLRLGYRLIHSRYQEGQRDYTYLPVPLAPYAQTEVEVPYLWDLSGLSLVPEDVVEYFAEVFDNDDVNGPKSAKSDIYLLRLPSLQEVFSDVNQGHEQSIEQIKQAMEEAKKLKEDIESINTDIKKNKDIDWQKQKKMEEMTKKYQEVQKKLQDVQKTLDEMVQKMDQQKVLSKETLEKYLELQQLFQQLNSSELEQALKQMQSAVQNVNKEQLQQAMQKMTFSEERFRQGIERTLELLKRIQIEQKVDEVKKRAQDLEKLQGELKDEAAKAANDAEKQTDAARKQEDLSAKEKDLENASTDLAKRMEEFSGEMPLDTLNTLNKQLAQEKLDQQMKSAAQQMRQGQMQQAQQSQQQIEKSLQNFSQQMDALQQNMLQQQSQHVMNELRKATENLLELSEREEALKQQSRDAAPNSSQLRQNAEGQLQTMQDLGNVVSGLGELSKRSFSVTPQMGQSVGEAMQHMENAMRSLDSRYGQMASQEQGSAMGSLNKAAVQVQDALQSMMQSGQGGPGGLMQQLQSLAGQQMGLNLKTEQLGQGMSMQQAAEAARLAKEQDAIRKSLDQLNKEAETSQQKDRLLGDLEKIGEDMKEVVSNLEQNNVNPETVRQQQRILSRMLDASKSMRERDYEKRRKSETGTNIVRKSPQELNPQDLNAMSKLRQDLLKALDQGYSKDYQELIRKYFEQLQKTENTDH